MRQAATAGLLFACRLLSGLWSALWYLAVLLGLLLYVSRDFFPKRKSKPLTSPAHRLRKLPRIYREGSDIFAEMPDGSKIALEPLEVKLYAMDCFEVICAGLVWEKTRIKLDESD
jgi:hypothetical protein